MGGLNGWNGAWIWHDSLTWTHGREAAICTQINPSVRPEQWTVCGFHGPPTPCATTGGKDWSLLENCVLRGRKALTYPGCISCLNGSPPSVQIFCAFFSTGNSCIWRLDGSEMPDPWFLDKGTLERWKSYWKLCMKLAVVVQSSFMHLRRWSRDHMKGCFIKKIYHWQKNARQCS